MARGIQYTFRRYEKKYMLTPEQYRFLKARLSQRMQPDEYGRYTLCNVYYDTPDYHLIRKSLEQPVYKEKLRIRSYGVPKDGDAVFLELKKKLGGVVYKRRATAEAGVAADCLAGKAPLPACQGELEWFLRRWQPEPKVFLAYDREALADRELEELRVTFDTNLRWRDDGLDLRLGDHGAPLLPPERVLMEIKIPGAAPVWLSRLLSEGCIFPASFSKYGTYYRQRIAGTITRKAVQPCA